MDVLAKHYSISPPQELGGGGEWGRDEELVFVEDETKAEREETGPRPHS